MIKHCILAITLFFTFLNIAYAENNLTSPLGEWITISDKTHDRSGVVKLYEENGKLYGKVIKIFPGSGRNPDELCTQCTGEFKNKPVLGLVFLWDFAKQSDGTWKEGKVLDPKEGKIYSGSITLIDGGKKLELRGYWGPFWRTQTWIRAKD